MEAIKPYKKGAAYSYALGAFPTYELIAGKKESILGVYIHSQYTDAEKIRNTCYENNIPVLKDDKLFSKVSDKENCYVIGVFNKYEDSLSRDTSHIVLVNPSNMGNLGTIVRTALGLGIKDLALITPCADVFNPKVIRASMGALFKMRIQLFSSFEEYRKHYTKQEIFTFMLNGENTLEIQNCPKVELFSLVFGNEATGLDDSYLAAGTSVCIPQSPEVDSLNITIAVGIGTFLFTHSKNL